MKHTECLSREGMHAALAVPAAGIRALADECVTENPQEPILPHTIDPHPMDIQLTASYRHVDTSGVACANGPPRLSAATCRKLIHV